MYTSLEDILTQPTEASNLTSNNHGPSKIALTQQTEASNLTWIAPSPLGEPATRETPRRCVS